MIWENKPDGISDCEGSPCLPPNVCWWPSEYSKPAICAPAGLDLNNFKERIAIDQSFAWLLAGSLLGLGVLGGILALLLVWLCLRYCRRSSNNNNENEAAQQGQQQQNYLFHRLRQLSFRLRHSVPSAASVPPAGQVSPQITTPLSALPNTNFRPVDLAERPSVARFHANRRSSGLGSALV